MGVEGLLAMPQVPSAALAEAVASHVAATGEHLACGSPTLLAHVFPTLQDMRVDGHPTHKVYGKLSEQILGCADCAVQYHKCQAAFVEANPATAALFDTLDDQRLSQVLAHLSQSQLRWGGAVRVTSLELLQLKPSLLTVASAGLVTAFESFVGRLSARMLDVPVDGGGAFVLLLWSSVRVRTWAASLLDTHIRSGWLLAPVSAKASLQLLEPVFSHLKGEVGFRTPPFSDDLGVVWCALRRWVSLFDGDSSSAVLSARPNLPNEVMEALVGAHGPTATDAIAVWLALVQHGGPRFWQLYGVSPHPLFEALMSPGVAPMPAAVATLLRFVLEWKRAMLQSKLVLVVGFVRGALKYLLLHLCVEGTPDDLRLVAMDATVSVLQLCYSTPTVIECLDGVAVMDAAPCAKALVAAAARDGQPVNDASMALGRMLSVHVLAGVAPSVGNTLPRTADLELLRPLWVGATKVSPSELPIALWLTLFRCSARLSLASAAVAASGVVDLTGTQGDLLRAFHRLLRQVPVKVLPDSVANMVLCSQVAFALPALLSGPMAPDVTALLRHGMGVDDTASLKDVLQTWLTTASDGVVAAVATGTTAVLQVIVAALSSPGAPSAAAVEVARAAFVFMRDLLRSQAALSDGASAVFMVSPLPLTPTSGDDLASAATADLEADLAAVVNSGDDPKAASAPSLLLAPGANCLEFALQAVFVVLSRRAGAPEDLARLALDALHDGWNLLEHEALVDAPPKLLIMVWWCFQGTKPNARLAFGPFRTALRTIGAVPGAVSDALQAAIEACAKAGSCPLHNSQLRELCATVGSTVPRFAVEVRTPAAAGKAPKPSPGGKPPSKWLRRKLPAAVERQAKPKAAPEAAGPFAAKGKSRRRVNKAAVNVFADALAAIPKAVAPAKEAASGAGAEAEAARPALHHQRYKPPKLVSAPGKLLQVQSSSLFVVLLSQSMEWVAGTRPLVVPPQLDANARLLRWGLEGVDPPPVVYPTSAGAFDYVNALQPLVMEETRAVLEAGVKDVRKRLGVELTPGVGRQPSALTVGPSAGGASRSMWSLCRHASTERGGMEPCLPMLYFESCVSIGGALRPSAHGFHVNDVLSVHGYRPGGGERLLGAPVMSLLGIVGDRPPKRVTRITDSSGGRWVDVPHTLPVWTFAPDGAPQGQALTDALRLPSVLWVAVRVANLSTNIREFQALHCLQYTKVAPTVLKPPWPTQFSKDSEHFLVMQSRTGDAHKPAVLHLVTPEDTARPGCIPRPLYDALAASHNNSQLAAMLDCVRTPAWAEGSGVVTLIQGPPGTGKTRTLLGALTCILSAKATGGGGGRAGVAPAPQPPVAVPPAAVPAMSMPPPPLPKPKPSSKRRAADGKLDSALAMGLATDPRRSRPARGIPKPTTAAPAASGAGRAPPPTAASVAAARRVSKSARSRVVSSASHPHLDQGKAKRVRVAATAPPPPRPPTATRGNIRRLGAPPMPAPPAAPSRPPLRGRVLVCAPSNAAVDEIVSRVLADGLLDSTGGRADPVVVRLGVSISSQDAVQAATLDRRVASMLRSRGGAGAVVAPTSQAAQAVVARLQDQLKGLKRRQEALVATIRAPKSSASQVRKAEVSLDVLQDEHQRLTDRLYDAAPPARGAATTPAAARKRVLEQANVVCSTLSTSVTMGHDIVYDALLVDEAAQAVEVSCLLPLRHRVGRVVLVGDPLQLPATVLSHAAANKDYNRSLFERLAACGLPTRLLAFQYRMHADISEFPSIQFYHNQLKDAAGVDEHSQPYNSHTQCFGHFRFFHVPGSEHSVGSSMVNPTEVKFVVAVLGHLLKTAVKKHRMPEAAFAASVGVITPYKAQATAIRAMLKRQIPKLDSVPVSTVDGFQGREKDVIVLSMVRSNSAGNIGFVADRRRMNVALTRAKYCALVVGDAVCLSSRNRDWRALVRHSCRRGKYVDTTVTGERRVEAPYPVSRSSGAVAGAGAGPVVDIDMEGGPVKPWPLPLSLCSSLQKFVVALKGARMDV